MAVLPMKRILICGMKKDRKAVLEFLQRQGVVEIRSENFEDEVFSVSDMNAKSAQALKNAECCDSALKTLDELVPAKGGGLFADYKVIGITEYDDLAVKKDEFTGTAEHIVELSKEIAEKTAEIPKLTTQKEALIPWKTLDIPLDFTGTRTTTAIAGTFAGETDTGELYSRIGSLHPEVDAFDLEVISSEKEQSCVLFLVRKDQQALLEDALRQMGFAKAPLSTLNPIEEIASLEKQIEEDTKEIEKKKQEITDLASEREHIRFIRDYYKMLADRYDAVGHMTESKRTFILSGYLAAMDVSKVQPKLEAMGVSVEISEPEKGEQTPIKLKNNKFTAPMESVVSNYSLPGRNEIDPSAVMAVFYYVFFGMMLSDAAYGLIITIACAVLLKKKKNMAEGMKKFLTMFFYCGISTTIWGFLFGGFFGDVVNVVAKTFFNRPDIALPALWFEPVKQPMTLLVYAFVFGIIHIFVGLAISMIQKIRLGDVKAAIYDCVFWYMLVGGLIVVVMTVPMLMQDMFQLSFVLPESTRTVALVIALIGMVGILLTGGRSSKNWGKRLMKGAYSVYGISGYLSDILSYSRLLALGLATGVIATVFNSMAAMVAAGKGFIGVILFAAIFLIGHVLNLAINALGAYVHTNRLQYVEFFGKFYEGGGRAIDPLTEDTKYYKVKEAK